MKLFILGLYLVLVLTYLENGKANKTWGRRKATNPGTTRSRSVKPISTSISLPNKSYSRKPQKSQPRIEKVQFDPKKASQPGQRRNPLKQTNKMTPKNKQKVNDIRASLRKMFENKKSSRTNTKNQNNNLKGPAPKKKTTEDIKSALNKYLSTNKSDKPSPDLKNTKTTSHSSIASDLRNFLTKQKGVKAGSSNKPRKLPRRICKRSTSDCVVPDLNDDAKTPTTSLKTEESHKKYLTEKGIKFNEAGLLGTVEKHENDVGPDIIFLEKGHSKAGLTHILEDETDEKGKITRKGHREDFKTSFGLQGSDKQIDSQIEQIILKSAATASLKTEIRGKGDKKQLKLIKEVEWKGLTKKINLAIGSNGFIVSSYPASSDKVKDAPKPDTDTLLGGDVELSKNQEKKAKKAEEIKAKIEAASKAKEEAKKVKPQPNLSAGSA